MMSGNTLRPILDDSSAVRVVLVKQTITLASSGLHLLIIGTKW